MLSGNPKGNDALAPVPRRLTSRSAAMPSRFRESDNASMPVIIAAPSRVQKRARGTTTTSAAPLRNSIAVTVPSSPQAPAQKRGRRVVASDAAPEIGANLAARSVITFEAPPRIATAEAKPTPSSISASRLASASVTAPRISLLAQPKHAAVVASQHGAFLRKTAPGVAAIVSTTISANVSVASIAAAPPPPSTAASARPVFERMASARGSLSLAALPAAKSMMSRSVLSTKSGAAGGSPSSGTSARTSIPRALVGGGKEVGTTSTIESGRSSIGRAVSATRWAHVAARTDTGRRPSLTVTTTNSAAALSASLRHAMTTASASSKTAFLAPAPASATAPPPLPQQQQQQLGTFDRHVSAVLTASAREALARASAGDAAGALSLFAALPASLPAVTGKAVFWVTRAAVLESAGSLSGAISCLVEGVAACRDAPPAEQDAVTQALARIAAQGAVRQSVVVSPPAAAPPTASVVAAPSPLTLPMPLPSPSLVSPMPEGLPRQTTPQRASRVGAVSRNISDSILDVSSFMRIYADDLTLLSSLVQHTEAPFDVGELAPAPRSPPPAPTPSMRVANRTPRPPPSPFAGGETKMSVCPPSHMHTEPSGIYGGMASMMGGGGEGLAMATTPASPPATPATPAMSATMLTSAAHAPVTQLLSSPLPPTPEASSSLRVPRFLQDAGAGEGLLASPLPASPLPVYIASALRAPRCVVSPTSQPLSQLDPESFAAPAQPATLLRTALFIAPDSLARAPRIAAAVAVNSPRGLQIILQSVHARASTARALGVPTFLSPVRRSLRVTPHASSQSLEDANFAWRGNESLPGASLRSGFEGARDSNASMAASYNGVRDDAPQNSLVASYMRGPMSMDI